MHADYIIRLFNLNFLVEILLTEKYLYYMYYKNYY